MPRNIEIKARRHDGAPQERIARELAGSPTSLTQDDTFFDAPRGYLKLRDFGGGNGELIFYTRPTAPGPKKSDYLIAPVSDPATTRAALDAALGTTARVRKQRTVYMIGQTRVHFDEVEGLGRFIELEVVLEDSQTEAEGTRIAEDLMRRLGIRPDDLVAGAYADLPALQATPSGAALRLRSKP